MVEVEIRTPSYDEEAGRIQWHRRAFVRAEGSDLAVYLEGEDQLVRQDIPVVDVVTGEQVQAADEPERWARNLPHAYRAGDIVAVVLLDTDPPRVERHESAASTSPMVPSPPELAEAALST